MEGFIVVDKPVGMTSHDVVSFMRRTLGTKKVGHTGTLDPFATGVLPVAVGEATKAIQFLDESVKEYRAVMRLGVSTDTDDLTGKILATAQTDDLDRAAVVAALESLVGKGMQVPPMYSAIKRNGIPLYKLARKGEEVERAPRPVEIYSLVAERIELPDVEFVVRCSRGTYVRTIASDIGKVLGCGAMLTALRRTTSGPFSLKMAMTPDAVAAAATTGGDLFVSIEDALGHLKAVELNETGYDAVRNGVAPRPDCCNVFPAEANEGETVKITYHGIVIAAGIVTKKDHEARVRILRGFNRPTYFTGANLCGNKNHFGSEQMKDNEKEAEGGATRCW